MTGTAIDVLVNGEPKRLAPGTRITDVVAGLVDARHQRGVAVARNGEVVARSAWETTTVEPGDVIEVVRSIQGG